MYLADSALPVTEAFTDPQVIAAMVSLVVVVLGVVSALVKLLDAKLNKRLDNIQNETSDVKKISASTHEQVANTHETNLRDDLDSLAESVRVLTQTTRDGLKRIDHQFGEVRDRQSQIERRVAGGEERAEAAHSRLWDHVMKRTQHR